MTGKESLSLLRRGLNGLTPDLVVAAAVHHHAAARGAAGQARRAVDGDSTSRRRRRRLVLLQENAGRGHDAVGRVGRGEAVDGERRRAAGHQGQLGRERVLVEATLPNETDIQTSREILEPALLGNPTARVPFANHSESGER